MGPTLRSKFRFSKTVNYNTAGPPPFVTFCESIGTDITGLADFTAEATVWDRFIITHAKLTVYILKQDVQGLADVNLLAYYPGIQPMVICYFND
jgi:hypothetical protein